ncbi:MAG: hypothetical protein ACUVQI_00775 [Thermochromatium sp.]
MFVTKMRWRIERDYRELKQEFGLGQELKSKLVYELVVRLS